ncbi:MAG: helix-turn-helix domain-containing protein [Clostridia bacterium]|nr:helix-turn-helix domain-containing protein [Clostridia bacterium]
MQNFAFRLKKLRKSKGLNQEELAQLLGVRKTTISNYETGYSSPTNATLRQMAECLGVSISELLGESPSMRESSSPLSSMRHIPLYEVYPGTGLTAVQPDSYFTLPAVSLEEGNYIALKISDERMSRAHLSSGSFAFIRRQPYVYDGDIAAAICNEELVLGRFYRSAEGFMLVPESYNSAYHPLFFSKENESVTIIGKVIKSLETVL